MQQQAGPALSRCNRCGCIGPRFSGAPSHGGWSGCLLLPDTLWARELWKGLQISLLANNYVVWMNNEFPLLVIERYQTCSILTLSVISTLHRVPLFMDRIWLLLLLVPFETEVDQNLLQTRRMVIQLAKEQVKTSVRRIHFDGSSANVTLFSSRKILLFLESFWQKLWTSSTTLVPVYQYIGRLYASISSINHAHYSIYCV